ncbi:hypothetical protein V8B55DRAFT_1362225 [Mucor lusitanicus]|uniref:U2A'/phosphoprotein 32 family A C-terminal domain-containing protein n=2 Tax=Mucor circinelloides f. lusitanicus TaxID=29924 RepID=A0A168LB56_MUCCL|nr:hypothetical protein MUCCIDRAFT_156102 [Mucor lusitanicus CBS 277.49]
MKLTTEVISEIYKDKPLESLKEVNASKREIDQVEDISACKQLRKLILAHNDLADEKSIDGLKNLDEMILLNLSNNKFKDFTGFQHFQKLNVLNVSHNELVHMSPHITRLKQLKALILNNNNLLEIENIEPLLQLNTLVISHNKIDTVPRLSSLAELTKLSAAHNQLTQVPDLSHNLLLKEIRLNDNLITEIPETLRKCNAIEIMDFGNNGIKDWKDIAPLGSLLKLHSLNLKGNPLANKKDYLEKILDLVPSLRILDGERFDPKFLERKKKQRENLNIVEKKQRMKRMKLQKEKKEKKAHGIVDEDGDVTMTETSAVDDKKKRKVKGTEIAKIKSKRSASKADMEDEPALKKKKKTDDGKDLFFLKPEDKPATEKKVKVVKAAPATKKTLAKKTQIAVAEKVAVEKVAAVEAPAPVAKAAAVPAIVQPVTKAQTGVVGVVDKSKKIKTANKKTTDIVAALESESKKKEDSSTGTGLDVGGWD